MTNNRQKTALVTGASSGIGFATAIEFTKRGYQVFAGARRLEAMEPLKAYGIITLPLDVTSTESIQNTKEIINEKTEGYLDVLFNNAGQPCAFAATDLTDDLFTKCYDVNVFGPMRLVREFVPFLIKAHGTIGFTGSVTGFTAVPFSLVYNSSKAAIHQYAATLRLEMRPFNVKVINIVTGGVKTDISEKRSYPETSIYNVEGFAEAILERKQMAVRNNPMSPDVYAHKVVNDFEKANGFNFYRGSKATFLLIVSYIVPRFILEYVLIRRFKLTDVFNTLYKKYVSNKKDV